MFFSEHLENQGSKLRRIHVQMKMWTAGYSVWKLCFKKVFESVCFKCHMRLSLYQKLLLHQCVLFLVMFFYELFLQCPDLLNLEWYYSLKPKDFIKHKK